MDSILSGRTITSTLPLPRVFIKNLKTYSFEALCPGIYKIVTERQVWPLACFCGRYLDPLFFEGQEINPLFFFFLYRLLKPLKIRESLVSIHQAPFSYRNGDSLRLHQFCLWRDNWFPLGLSICSWSVFPPSLLEFSSFCSYYHGGGFQNSLCTLLIIQKSRPCVFLELHIHAHAHAHIHTHTLLLVDVVCRAGGIQSYERLHILVV